MRIGRELGLFAIAGFVVLTALTAAGYASANTTAPSQPGTGGGGGCPNANAIGNFVPTSLVSVAATKGANTWSYYFSSLEDLNPVNGVPGLIAYCVYDGSTAPSSITVNAVGADGSSWMSVSKATGGYFGFVRDTGNPSNIGLDGTLNILMGSATWTSGAPSTQTILLHINDAAECQALYGGTANTCFVYPATPCGGNPVCKIADVAEATSTNPLTVPVNTTLHIHYTFMIVNAFSNNYNMLFPFSTFPTSDPNVTGLRDTFNCGETPDSAGSPGAMGSFANYQGTGFDLNISNTKLLPCGVERAILTNSGATIVLIPGQTIIFTIDMVTPGFTETGWQCLNYGVNLRWIQSNDGLVHAYHAPDIDAWVS